MIIQDIRYGLRMLVKDPGFTIMAAAALGLGIGVNSMMFTVYNAAMFKSLPFDRPQEIVYINHQNLPAGQRQIGVSYDDFAEYRRQTSSLTGISAFNENGFNFSDDYSLPERLTGTRLSANTFSVLGQKVFLGRDFAGVDERPGAAPVLILSYALWQTRYGGDSSILGKEVKINGQHHTVIGIMPPGMAFPSESRFWIPAIPSPEDHQRRSPDFDVLGRLHDQVTPLEAQTELKGVAARLASAFPKTNKDVEPRV